MPTTDLVTAGEAFEDVIFAALPRLPRPGEEVRTPVFARTVGGGAVITAIAAARLGARCAIVSGLSDAAARILRAERVRVVNLRRPGEPHAISAALSTARDRSFVTFEGMNPRLERRLAAPLSRIRARHVHFAFTPSRCRRWRAVIARFHRERVTTSWDPGWDERLLDDPELASLMESVDYLLMNEQEARLYSRARTLRAAAAYWKAHARATVIKMGRGGSRWLSRDEDVRQAPFPVSAVDTTGAGDAFNGGFLVARLAGAGPREALAAGNRIGALSTRGLGGIDGLPRTRTGS